MIHRRNDEAAERSAERRRKEDDAPRLLAVAPNLEKLHFEVDETREGDVLTGSAHTRRFVLTHAPALFVFPCGDRACSGSHDVTRSVLRSIERRETAFTGEDACYGDVVNGRCQRTLRYRAFASYQPESPAR